MATLAQCIDTYVPKEDQEDIVGNLKGARQLAQKDQLSAIDAQIEFLRGHKDKIYAQIPGYTAPKVQKKSTEAKVAVPKATPVPKAPNAPKESTKNASTPEVPKAVPVETKAPVATTKVSPVVEKGSGAAGKGAKVVGSDGIERRFATESEAQKAIKEGTVDKAPMYEGSGTRTSKIDKALSTKLTPEQDALAKSYMDNHPASKKIQELNSRIENEVGKGKLGKDDALIRDDAVKELEAEKTKAAEDYSRTAEASRLVLAQGKELTEDNVKGALKSLKKKEENARKGTGKNVSADTLFESEEMNVAEDAAEASVVNREPSNTLANIHREKGTGKKISAEIAQKRPKDSVEKALETPDGKYKVVDKVVDNKVQMDVIDTASGKVLKTVDNPTEAQEVIKDHRRSTVQVTDQVPDKPKVVVRRKASEKPSVDGELSPRFMDLAKQYLGMHGQNPTKAWGKLNDANLKGFWDPQEVQDAKEYLKKLESITELQAAELASRFPNGLALLENIAKEGPGLQRNLAKMLLEYVPKEKLENITVAMSYDINKYKNGIIFLKPDASEVSQLHELVHAITVQEMGVNEELRAEVEGMRSKALEYAKKNKVVPESMLSLLKYIETSEDFFNSDFNKLPEKQRQILYGLLNRKEFLSQAFSSWDFQNFLKEVPGEGARKNILGQLWSTIKMLLGFKGDPTLLEDVLNIVPDISKVDLTGTVSRDTSANASIDILTPDAYTAQVMRGSGPGMRLGEELKKQGRNLKEFSEKLLRPISDIIKAIDDRIWGRLMKEESRKVQLNSKYSKMIEPYLRFYTGLTQSQKVRLDAAFLNYHMGDYRKVVQEMVPKDAWKGVQELLSAARARYVDVGLLTEEELKEHYFPRRVQNISGLLQELHKLDDVQEGGLIGDAFRAEAARLGVVELTPDQKTQVMTDMFQSGHFRSLPRPGAAKERSVPYVTPDTFKFYSSSADALMGFIYDTNEKVGNREFIGMSTRKSQIADLMKMHKKITEMSAGEEKDTAIADYDLKAKALENEELALQEGISSMVWKVMGDKSYEDQQRVMNLLNARLRQRGASGTSEFLRNLGYASTMGNFLSAISQIPEIFTPMFRYGLSPDTVSSMMKGIGNVLKVAKNELLGRPQGTTGSLVEEADFTRSLNEFANGSFSGKMLETLFKYSGLKFVDLMGKEAFMQASMKHYQNPKFKEEFYKNFKDVLGSDIDATYAEIQRGEKTENVMAVLIAELSGFQPISLSQYSEAYLGAGNARIFWMLKSYTLRATSRVLMEGTERFKKASVAFENGDKVEGMKLIGEGTRRMVTLMLLYSMAGAGAEELKDLLRGKETPFQDNVVDNLLKFLMISRYTWDQGVQQDGLTKAVLAGNIVPPVRYLDTFAADAYALMSEDKEFKFKTLAMVPFVGTIGYARSAAGQQGYTKRERTSILDVVKENKADGKGAYSGGLSQRISEYNSKVLDPKDRITNDTIQRAYKGDKK